MTPDWLTRHGCTMKPTSDGKSQLVLVGSDPQYQITPLPMGNQFGCAVKQTINGKRLDTGKTFATAQEALQGGLEDLRQGLGW